MGHSAHPALHRPERAGFAWNLFEPVPLYDEVAHYITPFTLVAILAEIIYRGGTTTSSSTRCGAL